MKPYLSLFLIILFFTCSAQSLQVKRNSIDYKNCKNIECQIKHSFLTAEYYLEEDDIFSSQKWLDITKNKTSLKKIDSTSKGYITESDLASAIVKFSPEGMSLSQSDAESVAKQTFTKMDLGDSLSTASTSSISDGRFDVLDSGRWHRAAFTFTGDHRILAGGMALKPEGTV